MWGKKTGWDAEAGSRNGLRLVRERVHSIARMPHSEDVNSLVILNRRIDESQDSTSISDAEASFSLEDILLTQR